jgi:hypothetical protein
MELTIKVKTSNKVTFLHVTGGMYKANNFSPQHADLRLLVIPTSYKRVSVYNLNWGNF